MVLKAPKSKVYNRMPITHALFFDNDITYVNQFLPYCDLIMPFHVGGLQHIGSFPVTLWSDPAMVQYVGSLTQEGRDFADVVKNMTVISFSPNEQGDVIDFESGITEDHYYTITNALIQIAAREGVTQRIAAIFDFDRTLSIIEGFIGAISPPVKPNSGIEGYINHLYDSGYLQTPTGNLNVTPNGIIEYILGGPRRKYIIQTLIAQICNMGHPVIILTNNAVGINNPEFIKDFFPGYQNQIEVICARPFNGNKPLALKSASQKYDRLFVNPAPPDNQFYIELYRSPGQQKFVTTVFPKYKNREVVAVSNLFPPYEAFQNISAGKDGFVALGVLAVLSAILLVSIKRR